MAIGETVSRHTAGIPRRAAAPPILLVALLLSGCAGTTEIPANCDYKTVAEQAIAEKYPWYEPETPLELTRQGAVVVARYPLPRPMPGGGPHTEVRVRDCSVGETWLTQ